MNRATATPVRPSLEALEPRALRSGDGPDLTPPPTPANHAPAFVSVAVETAAVGTAYSYAVKAADADGDALALVAAQLPAWLNLADHGDGTATLSGTPARADAGGVSVTLVASDGVDTATHTFTLGVSDAAAGPTTNRAPAFTSTPVGDAVAGQAYAYAVVTSDADGDARTFSADALPSWLTLVDHGDGTATLSGVPTAAGGQVVVLHADDGHTSTDQPFELTVAAAPEPTPSPDVPAGLYGSTLAVFGTDAADDIHVWSPSGQDGVIRVVLNGRIWNYDKNAVATIRVDAGAGDDVVAVDVETRAGVGAYVYANDGDDVLLGGRGNDTLSGGTGDDVIEGAGGDDLLNGNGGNDRVLGGDGDDRLNGQAGRDSLSGDGGQDALDGGAGRDNLYAQDGAFDVLDSDDNDVAFIDADDAVSGSVVLLS